MSEPWHKYDEFKIGDFVLFKDELYEIINKTRFFGEVVVRRVRINWQNPLGLRERILRLEEVTKATPVDIVRWRKK